MRHQQAKKGTPPFAQVIGLSIDALNKNPKQRPSARAMADSIKNAKNQLSRYTRLLGHI
jgi:hypothetical protein